ILPTALCKNIIANLGVNGTITVLPSAINNGSSDNCSFTLSLNSPTFTCANIGLINTVTLTVTDLSGNTATCTARVTVRDVSPPTSLCKPVTIFLNGAGQATLSINQVDNGSTDNCGIDSRTLLRTQFNCGDIASPVINVMTVTDNSGNSSTCTAAITVRDNIAPTAICQDVVVALVNGSVTVQSSQLAANSTDNCSVTSYAPVAQTYFVPGVYNLTITVRDWSNNGANCTSVITVLPSGPSPRPEAPSTESEPSASLNLSAYPNPTDGLVVLEFELPEAQAFVLRAFNLDGKAVLIQKGMGAKGANSISVQLDSEAPGLYFLELSSEELRAGKRLMINR
ncbi:MAG: T9SS type A sorting domain-containing protein, partial [Saprospiraceae bacterium]|nr:T9SS type A sorting domain-containing protein [Saprospiraceae bacterium]